MFQLVTMRPGSIVKMAKSAALSTMSSNSSALPGDVCDLSGNRGAPSGSTQVAKAFDAHLFQPVPRAAGIADIRQHGHPSGGVHEAMAGWNEPRSGAFGVQEG